MEYTCIAMAMLVILYTGTRYSGSSTTIQVKGNMHDASDRYLHDGNYMKGSMGASRGRNNINILTFILF